MPRKAGQVIKPTIAPDLNRIMQNKPRLVKARAGIRRKMIIPSTPQLSKHMQSTSKLTLQHPESTVQPKTF